MLLDTDILVYIQRGNIKAARLLEKTPERCISIMTYMELLQGAKNKEQHKYIFSFIKEFNFRVLPLSENIGHRASIYVEEYSLSHNMRAGDAIIAATAIENNLILCTANGRHFAQLKELNLNVFKP